MSNVEPNAPATSAAAVTPSDTVPLAPTRALYVGAGGAIAVEMEGSGEVILAGAQAGSILPLRVLRVLDTGTTATNIIALW